MTATHYRIVLAHPDRFAYVDAFREIIETLQADFAALGLQVPLMVNQLPHDPDVTAIVFGAHLLRPDDERRLPPQTILYNTERLYAGDARIVEDYRRLLANHEVWDCDGRNVELIREGLGNGRAHHMPLGYCPIHSRIPPDHEDVDVLFYGRVSERRRRVLEALHAAKVKVVALDGVFGAERDNAIARAKIVLNMHVDDGPGFESLRIMPLLANRKAVVCEEAGTDLPAALRDGMKVVPYDRLAAACLELLDDADERGAVAARGFAALTERMPPSAAILAQRLGLADGQRTTGRVPPAVLIAGAGRRGGIACVNADINPRRQPDWLVDFGRPLPFGSRADLGRHGAAEVRPGMFDAIIAHHLLEHIPDLTTAMSNFLALLRDGGALHIEVPYDLSLGAWQDPTHVRAFNERSWFYFTENHDYLDWQDARFDLVNLTFLLSPLGRQMRAQGHDDEVILRTPRAVDFMRAALVRRSIGAAGRP